MAITIGPPKIRSSPFWSPGSSRGTTAAFMNKARPGLFKAMHRSGADMAKFSFGFGKMAGKGVGRLLGPAMTLYAGYEGYKEGGAWGAAKGVASEVGTQYAIGAGLKGAAQMLKGPIGYPLIGAVGAIGVGLAGWTAAWHGGLGTGAGVASPWQAAVRPLVADYMRRHSEVEMGRPIVDQYGTLATMRQRSLAAIQNSKINGRSVIGNEATYRFRPYFT